MVLAVNAVEHDLGSIALYRDGQLHCRKGASVNRQKQVVAILKFDGQLPVDHDFPTNGIGSLGFLCAPNTG